MLYTATDVARQAAEHSILYTLCFILLQASLAKLLSNRIVASAAADSDSELSLLRRRVAALERANAQMTSAQEVAAREIIKYKL